LLAASSAAFAVSAASCAAPAIEDDLGGSSALPDRAPVAPSDEGGASDGATPVDGGAADAADAAVVVTQAQLCGEPELVLCFGFEGAITDGSPNLLVPAVSGVTFAPGKLGQAASFGPASAMRFAASPALEVTKATVEAWIKRAPNATGDGVIFDDDNRFSLTIEDDGGVLCKPGGVASAVKVVADRWTHVACAFDGAAVVVYVDGVGQSAGAGAIGSSPASTAALGGNAPSGEPFVGLIDSFRAFRVARTPAQILAAAGK
jgi:hypothetical protein